MCDGLDARYLVHFLQSYHSVRGPKHICSLNDLTMAMIGCCTMRGRGICCRYDSPDLHITREYSMTDLDLYAQFSSDHAGVQVGAHWTG